MRIPEETIQQIRESTDIVEYIGAVVRLKKRGKNYVGLCPFHSEKTPSFNVSADKQMYYCFGCQQGGDIVKFVMETEKVSYIEALEILAEKKGIVIQRIDDGFASATETEKLYAACTFAAKTFYRNLTASEEGKFALNYFRQRAFEEKTIIRFGLGYSLRAWDGLVREATENGVDVQTLEKVGLARKREDGSFYDVFRGRAMFPIFSPAGQVIGFGARKLYEDDSLGKYVNSSETTIYHKSKVLYGISQAKESIREKESVILVEGYADLISISQAGFLNVVASSGTALTSEQVQLIGRYTRNITFVYDADSAGQSAMIRGVDTILEGGLDVRVAELPQGEDPDSFVRTHGKAALNELLSKAVSFIDFKAGVFQREGKFNSPEGKAEVVRQLIQTIAKISDQLKRSFFIKDIATKYGLYESALLQELEKTRGKVPIPVPMITKAQSIQQEKKSESLSRAAEIPIEEKEILTVLLTDAVQFMPAITSVITANDLTHPIAREAFNLIVDEYDVSGIIEVLEMIKRPISDDVRILMQDLTFSRYSLSAKWDGIGPRAGTASLWERAEGAVKRLKKKVLQKSLEENQQKMKNASLTGAETMPLLKQHQSIISELKDIESMKLKDPSSESTQEVED